ncbi:MAG TPA: EamA family transporter [Deltaproteobacteria bacterium]|jgi:drug/metabolite transporter (DMT)-like permease|nr:EamA family transporter [Deltaproteobacteria bacterium]
MNSSNSLGGVASIHAATLAVGMAGLFGKFLEHSPVLITQGRSTIAALALAVVLSLQRKRPRLSGCQWFWLAVTGGILAAHWVTFFHAIQVSTVAIGLLSFSSYPLFTTLIEPWVFREPLRPIHLGFALAVMVGIALIATSESGNSANPDVPDVLLGVGWGLVSGFTLAVLTILNRLHVQTHSPLLISCTQNGFAALALLPFSAGLNWHLDGRDWSLLLALGLICTAGGYALFLHGLQRVRAQLASLILAGMESVYAILFAMLLLSEIPSLQTVLGGIFIIGTTVVASFQSSEPTTPTVTSG